jgi:predicted RNase H-like nuclease (RuvC/YqgF family)
VFCWANATVSIYNAKTQKTLKPQINETKGGWTNSNYKKAREEAFDELVKKIAEKVVPLIKN